MYDQILQNQFKSHIMIRQNQTNTTNRELYYSTTGFELQHYSIKLFEAGFKDIFSRWFGKLECQFLTL